MFEVDAHDSLDDFDRALARLEGLRDSAASQADADQVFEAVQALQLAVTRLYGMRPRARSGQGARARILEHLRANLGVWVTGDELAAVSGIGEWARRVRELRVEMGFLVEEQGGSYRLSAAEPDPVAVRRWQAREDARRGGGSPKDRVLAFLASMVGEVVTTVELDSVAGAREGTGLIKELRDEEGWPIESAIDCAVLRVGEFRLLSLDDDDRRDAVQRLFPESIRAQVFRRDGHRCWICRRGRDAAEDPTFYLLVHHLSIEPDDLDRIPVAELIDPASLATVCRHCLPEQRAALRRRRRYSF